jgi:hypothetical protein
MSSRSSSPSVPSGRGARNPIAANAASAWPPRRAASTTKSGPPLPSLSVGSTASTVVVT